MFSFYKRRDLLQFWHNIGSIYVTYTWYKGLVAGNGGVLQLAMKTEEHEDSKDDTIYRIFNQNLSHSRDPNAHSLWSKVFT